jgi:5'-nucleotidase
MSQRRPKILLTNDDGIDAPGINALRAELKGHYDVLVVAPMYEKSGAGCSLSLSNEMEVAPRGDGEQVYGHAVNGTPADCVKFAITALDGYRPDFILSGINRGMNAGNSVFYSGTVAGAIEGTLFGYPAMACSLACWHHPVPFYEDAAKIVAALLPWLLEQQSEPRTLWNLNMPNRRFQETGRVRLTSHGTSFFNDEFALYRQEGDVLYYKNVGEKLVACEKKPDSDDRIIEQGDISLSLLRTDLTVEVPRAAARSLEAVWAGLLKR